MIYLAPFIGTGTEDNPFSVPMYGPGCGMIDLRGDCTQREGLALIYVPGGMRDARLTTLGICGQEPLAAAARQSIESRLGITLRQRATLADAIAELLLEHAAVRTALCNPLQPETERDRYQILLGDAGVLWSAPAPMGPHSQQRQETWPNTGDIGTVAADQTWVAVSGPTLEVAAGSPNYARSKTLATPGGVVRTNDILDTDNHEHYFTAELVSAARNIVARAGARRAASSTDTQYYAHANRNTSNFIRALSKVVAGANTTLYSDTTNPGSPITLGCKCDGSSITGTWGSFSSTQTDTGITGNKAVYLLVQSPTGGNVNDAKAKSHFIRDLQATLDAAGTAAVTVSGALTTSITVAADVSGAASVGGALTTQLLLQGAATCTATTSGAVTTEIRCAGTLAAAATATSALATEIPLSGPLTGTVAAAAVLTADIRLTSGILATASMTGVLQTTILLQSSLAVTAALAAELLRAFEPSPRTVAGTSSRVVRAAARSPVAAASTPVVRSTP